MTNEFVEKSINDSIISYSERSRLYALQPEGKGSPFVESISSYLCRIAESHNIKVSTLFFDILYPLLPSYSYLKNLKGKKLIRGSSLLGIGKTAIEIVSALEKLTKRDDLQALTLLNWSAILNLKLISQSKRWCSNCFNEMKESGQRLYEPLIWQIKEISICGKHLVSLREICINCHKRIQHYSSNLQIGFCPFCNIFLGENPIVETSDELGIDSTQKVICNMYSQLLKNNYNSLVPTKRVINNFFLRLKNENPSISYSNFARNLAFSSSQMETWFNGECKPPISFWAVVCEIMGVSIEELFIKYHSLEALKPLLEKRKKSEKRVFINKENKQLLEMELMKYLNSGEGNLSLLEFSRIQGYTPGVVKRHFPKLSEEVIEKNKEKINNDKIIFYDSVEKQIRKKLNNKGVERLSLTRILEQYGISYQMGRKYLPQLCDEVSNEYQQYIIEKRKKEIFSNEEEIKNIVMDMHNQGMYPINSKITKKHSIPLIFRNSYYREYRDSIKRELGYFD
ncbi:TniQ family protein [Bacillus cereus group sp. BY112LC]|uniref:TniQ family protein n=1 Tax=Bacillus cereus group sp. BY112LC TaxID=3018086 RepID=UPI0022DF813D|nr:TniQ family protein [Bacillus cereus group sp. BY112LC]MDA1874427.1 TniQ family protein [Bacillus cereus group sp. BY112LC]